MALESEATTKCRKGRLKENMCMTRKKRKEKINK
jgi:hypothetical protein